MEGHPLQDSSQDPPAEERIDDQEQLKDLRKLLIGPEMSGLEEVRRKLDNPKVFAEALSNALPQAIALRAKRDEQLAKSLQPTIEKSIQTSVHRDPQPIVDAIFPIIGPAIRRSIAETLKTMLQSFNRGIQYGFTLRGLRWRLEAMRSGRSFGEVVLLHTLNYRVEEVFLIHSETGLLLGHATAEEQSTRDADMVSGMLTALQDFVKDSFGAAQEDHLEQVNMGDVALWIRQGPSAILACAVQGEGPEDLKGRISETLETIHVQFSNELEDFDGDMEATKGVLPIIVELLEARQGDDERRKIGGPALWIVLTAAISLLAAFGWWIHQRNVAHQDWQNLLADLRQLEGSIITEVYRKGDTYHIWGLRDPLGEDPEAAFVASSGADQAVEFHWDTYVSLDPDLCARRAEMHLQPPDSVELSLENGILSATGSAEHLWLEQARLMAIGLPGISNVVFDEVVDRDLVRIEEIRKEVEKVELHFQAGASLFVAGQEDLLELLQAKFQELNQLAALVGQPVSLQIIGHSSQEGTDRYNEKISKERAGTAGVLLNLDLFPNILVSTAGMGAVEPVRTGETETDRQFNRRVEFRVGGFFGR